LPKQLRPQRTAQKEPNKDTPVTRVYRGGRPKEPKTHPRLARGAPIHLSPSTFYLDLSSPHPPYSPISPPTPPLPLPGSLPFYLAYVIGIARRGEEGVSPCVRNRGASEFAFTARIRFHSDIFIYFFNPLIHNSESSTCPARSRSHSTRRACTAGFPARSARCWLSERRPRVRTFQPAFDQLPGDAPRTISRAARSSTRALPP
jgi:hypothetical protein